MTDPLDLYMASVRDAGSLREALVIAASLIGDQLDPGMQAEGLIDDWAGEYGDFSRMMESDTEGLEGEELQTYEFFWGECSSLFSLYQRHHQLTDWDLYAETVDPANPGWDRWDDQALARYPETCDLSSFRKEEHVKMVWASIIPFIHGWAQPVTSEG